MLTSTNSQNKWKIKSSRGIWDTKRTSQSESSFGDLKTPISHITIRIQSKRKRISGHMRNITERTGSVQRATTTERTGSVPKAIATERPGSVPPMTKNKRVISNRKSEEIPILILLVLNSLLNPILFVHKILNRQRTWKENRRFPLSRKTESSLKPKHQNLKPNPLLLILTKSKCLPLKEKMKQH